MQTLRISKTKLTTKNKFTVDLIALGCEKKNSELPQSFDLSLKL